MPTTYFDAPSIPLSYEQLTSWAEYEAASQGVNINAYLGTVNTMYPDADLTDFMIDETSKYLDFYQNGDGTYTVIGAYRDYQDTTYSNPVDSNSSQIARGRIKQMVNDGVENVGGVIKRHMTTFPSTGSLGQKASYVVGSVGGAIAAASTGITLGKIISPHLYEVAPNFWESVGVTQGAFDPDNWITFTNGSDSPFAGLLNFILGIDPESGQTQAYMDENAFAYMAMAMAQNGVFAEQQIEGNVHPEGGLPSGRDYANNFVVRQLSYAMYSYKDRYNRTYTYEYSFNKPVYAVDSDFTSSGSNYEFRQFYCDEPFVITKTYTNPQGEQTVTTENSTVNSVTFNGETYTFYRYNFTISKSSRVAILPSYVPWDSSPYPNGVYGSVGERDAGYIILTNLIESGGVEGIDNQDGATLPNVSDWDDISDVLPSLQQQYPDLFDNGITYDNIQPDGTILRNRYLPVSMPDATYNNDNQPISGDATQTQSKIGTGISTDTLLKLIADTVQATQTQTQPQQIIPPSNPVDTGTGEPPALVPPSGSASALWSVYHPTQAQVNSFGAWLWTDNIITQIQQLLQNPMEGIITLHKVFAPPVDSGQGTIVVGRLDSNVPSATVNQQYVTVDCGEIDCVEQFGNVFDYSPFTNISIYLPFIGIAPLSVNDIMRSKIHVTYGVDVFTGVCLAMIEVSRDGNTVNMYQYAGVASVEYPLTGTVHNGLITGIMGIVGGFATIATAGAAAPVASAGGVAAAGAGALSTGRQSQSRSGNFSGNAGAMGIKTPYLIIERPQTKVADTFPQLAGYPTNKSVVLNECSGHIVVKHVHVEGINATQGELIEIENLLQSGVLV